MADAGSSWTTIAMVLFVIIGCILIVFLGYMVRSAYDLRIGLKAQMDKGLRSVEEDGAKKARALRQELGAEIERARHAVIEDARRRLTDSLAAMEKRQSEFESTVRQERIEMSVSFDMLRDEISALTRRVEDLERELLVGDGGAARPKPAPQPVVTPLRPASGSVAPLRFTPPTSATSAMAPNAPVVAVK
jgi:hypothetical protein